MCRGLLHEVPEPSSLRQRGSSQTLSKRRSVVKHEMRRASADPAPSHTDPDTKPKRRTQLACTRCRQRKIKCSGESSEGGGCEKCREAKNADCVFLRAGSTLVETRQSTRVYRTHHSMMSSSSTPVTTIVSPPYGNQFVQSLPAAMSSSSSPMLDTTRSQSLSDMGSHYSPPSPWPRGGSIYHTNSLIEDVYAAPYDSSSNPAYVYPRSSSISYTGGGYQDSSSSSPSSSREWEPAASGSRFQSAVLYSSEADTIFSSSSSSSMAQNSSAAASSGDIPSLFPIVNMLSTEDVPIIGGVSSSNSNSTNDSELIGSGLPFMASEYFAYPMHRLNSTTSFRPKSSSTTTSTTDAAAVSPLKSDFSTSPFYMNVPYDSSTVAASAVPMTSVYDRSDHTVGESNPSEESLVMSSMSTAGLKESPRESGSYEYEYANREQQKQYSNVESDNSSTSTSTSTIILGNQQQYGGHHFEQSNNNNPAVEYNYVFEGFLQQASAGPNESSNHEY